MSWISDEIESAAALLDLIRCDKELIESIEQICEAVVECLQEGGQILTLGNGGSAVEANHLAEELIGRFRGNRPPLAAVCLAVDGPALTCIANDFGYDEIFARQVTALCRPGDIVMAFSTSGEATNLNRALDAAHRMSGRTIGLLGRDGGKALGFCDLAFVVPHDSTARIQEIHTLALHLICEAVEREFVSHQESE